MENISCTLEDIMIAGEVTLVIYSFMIQVGYSRTVVTVIQLHVHYSMANIPLVLNDLLYTCTV